MNGDIMNNMPGAWPPDEARLEALLDQTLAARAAPAGLNQRIMAQTAGLLRHSGQSVLARLDQSYRWPRALAAGVVAAALLGIVLAGGRIVRSAHTLISVDRGLAALPAYQLPGGTAAVDGGAESADGSLRQYTTALQDAQDDLERGLVHIQQHAQEDNHG